MVCECYEEQKDEYDEYIARVSQAVTTTLAMNTKGMCDEMRDRVLVQSMACLVYADLVLSGRIEPESKLGVEEMVAVVFGRIDELVKNTRVRARELIQVRVMEEMDNGVRH